MKAMNIFYFALCLAALLLGESVKAMADEEICVHGHSAQSQTPHSAPVYYGWGITLAPPSHDGNWLHYSIPTRSGRSLKAIKVKYSTGSNGDIDAIHIWDGDALKVQLEHLGLKGSETKVVALSPEQAVFSVAFPLRLKLLRAMMLTFKFRASAAPFWIRLPLLLGNKLQQTRLLPSVSVEPMGGNRFPGA